MSRALIAVASLALAGLVQAQTSDTWKVEEHAFNSGGVASLPSISTSRSFTVSLASIGDTVRPVALAGGPFTADIGFVAAYPPPGEVSGLRFADAQTLVWTADRSAGHYDLYRDDASDGYGDCEVQNLTATTTEELSTPAAGEVFHYLVTVTNRLGEEGTKGFHSDGTERLGSFDLSACP